MLAIVAALDSAAVLLDLYIGRSRTCRRSSSPRARTGRWSRRASTCEPLFWRSRLPSASFWR